MSKEVNGDPQFFSLQKILVIRAYQETKETAKEEKRHQKTLQKKEVILRRQQLQAEKQETAVQRQLRQETSKETKVPEKEQRTQERETKRRQKELDKQNKAAATLERKKT